MELSENDIIRIYGHRWDIEVFFKTCKSILLLRKEYHGLSSDGLTAHVAMVFTRYMLLAVSKRDNEDKRTLGELFYLMIAEMADKTYQESMQIIVEAKSPDMGHVLENIIYLELKRRWDEVYVGKAGDSEIDFVAMQNGERC